ncbi:transposase [Kitasatospora sp. NPDC005751]|uniref:transposase n=1 Tax=Kitasatospora sp. NPDC005751 TaxID=3157064 RepID=UPI0033E6A397
MTSKVHLAAGRRCRPLALVLTAGQAGDSPQFVPVLAKVRVRLPLGRPRTRPGAVAADKAYSSRANRAYLRNAASRLSSRRRRTKSLTARRRAAGAVDPSTMTPSSTKSGTQSSA